VVVGDPAQVRFLGVAPQLDPGFTCLPGPFCFGFATWDMTDQVDARLGGEFTITAEPIPPGIDINNPPTIRREGGYGLGLDPNYPWQHGGETGALTLTFEAACPKSLSLEVMNDKVRPVVPADSRERVPSRLAGVPTQATVKAIANTCPPQGGSPPASVVVDFEVRAPAPGSADAGGHDLSHPEPRPAKAMGTLDKPFSDGGQAQASCTVTNFDAEGMGSCTVTYHPSEVSGVETIAANASGFNEATAKITVHVPGLVNIRDAQGNFFRLVGETSAHQDNHWGTPDQMDAAGNVVTRGAATNIQLVALDFATLTCATPERCAILQINDMSLPLGGLFDICGTWNRLDTCGDPPAGGHRTHRTGRGVDISKRACRGLNPDGSSPIGDCPTARGTIRLARDTIERLCLGRDGTLADEPNYHCDFRD
jgi:hypothetical protein